jgi:multisubunit Na+/H+ antiporter MnhB subunit
MTLLVTVFAAIICTIIWYKNAPQSEMKVEILSLIYWGASFMWFVDAIFEYTKLKEAYFKPEPVEMLNDLFLGLSVVALGLIIWLVILLIKDPKGVVRTTLLKKKD